MREGGAQRKKKYGFRFETLDEDAVEERDERPDRQGSLGSPFATWVKKDKMNECTST
jgi:hypothetical protein